VPAPGEAKLVKATADGERAGESPSEHVAAAALSSEEGKKEQGDATVEPALERSPSTGSPATAGDEHVEEERVDGEPSSSGGEARERESASLPSDPTDDRAEEADDEEDDAAEESTAVVDPTPELLRALSAADEEDEEDDEDEEEPTALRSVSEDLLAASAFDEEPSPPAEPSVDESSGPPTASPAGADGHMGSTARRPPVWAWAAAALGFLALLGGGWLAFSGDESGSDPSSEVPGAAAEPPSPPEPAPAPVVAEPDPEPSEPPEPEGTVDEPPPETALVTLTLSGVPAGATVVIDGDTVEGTTVELEPAPRERHVEVRLADHETWSATVAGDEDAQLEVELQPLPPPEPVARPEAAARPRPHPHPRRRPTVVTDPGF